MTVKLVCQFSLCHTSMPFWSSFLYTHPQIPQCLSIPGAITRCTWSGIKQYGHPFPPHPPPGQKKSFPDGGQVGVLNCYNMHIQVRYLFSIGFQLINKSPCQKACLKTWGFLQNRNKTQAPSIAYTSLSKRIFLIFAYILIYCKYKGFAVAPNSGDNHPRYDLIHQRNDRSTSVTTKSFMVGCYFLYRKRRSDTSLPVFSPDVNRDRRR